LPAGLTLPSDREIVVDARLRCTPPVRFRGVDQARARGALVRLSGLDADGGEIDLRPGGAYRSSCARRRRDHTMKGVYREIVPPGRLVYTEGYVTEGFGQQRGARA